MAAPVVTSNGSLLLERECASVLTEVQNSFAALVESLLGGMARATELQKRLKVDSALAWGVHRAASAPSVLGAGLFLPGPASMRKFFKHARAAGADEAMVARAEAAHVRFEALVERHADDRGVFNAMLADLDQQSSQRVAYRKQKRAAFRTLRYLLGSQTDTIVNTMVLSPGEGEDVDAAILSGVIGLRHFRPHVEYTRQILARRPQAELRGTGVRVEAIDEDPLPAGEEAIGLLSDAALAKGVTFTTRPAQNGYTAIDVRLSQPGKLGTASYVFGWVERGHIPKGRTSSESANFSCYTATPTEVMLLDVIVFDGVWNRGEPTFGTFGRRKFVNGRFEYDDADLLPVQDRVRNLGRGLRVAGTPLVPQYTELLSRVARRLKVDPEACSVYRARNDHPILNTYMRLKFE